MKYSKTALGLLNAQYRSVLRKCMLINLGLFAITAIAATPANAADGDVKLTVDGSTIATSASGTVIGAVEGLGSAAYTASTDYATSAQGTKADSAYTLVNDTTKGNEALSTAINTANGKISSLETSVATKADQSDLDTLNSKVSTIQGNISDLQTNKADATTVTSLASRVTTLESKDYQTSSEVTGAINAALAHGGDAYQTASQVSSSITGAVNDLDADVSNTVGADGLSLSITQTNGVITAITGSIASGTYATAAQGALADSAVQSANLANKSLTIDAASLSVNGKAVLTENSTVVQSIAAGDSAGTLKINGTDVTISTFDAAGAAATAKTEILAGTGYADSGLETAVKGTKVDSAAAADSAKAVTSDAVDGSSIGLNGSGKLEVVSVAASKVSGLANVATSGAASDITTDDTHQFVTATDKTKLAGIEAGAEVNTIETIKVNGTALIPDADKAVNITVATKTSELANDSNFQNADQVSASITSAVNALDATVSNTVGTDGLSLTVVQTDGKITSITGSIAAGTYVAAAANNTFTGTNTFNDAVTMTQDVTMNADLVVNGDTTLGDVTADSVKAATLESTGNTKANSLEVTTTATVGQSLTVTGMTNANGGLTTSNLVLNGASLTGADTGASPITTGSANTVATTATVLKSAEHATFTGTPLTGKTATTVKAALTDANAAINTLNGGANDSGSVLNSVKTAAQNADFTAGSSTALTGQTKIGGAINTLGTAVDKINTAITFTADGNYYVEADSVAGAVKKVDAQVKTNADAITGFNDKFTSLGNNIGGTWSGDGKTFTHTPFSTANNISAADASLTTAISDLDTAIGKVATGTYNAISASNNVAANLQALDGAFTSGNIDAKFKDTTVNSLKIGEANIISGSADTIDMNKNSLTNVKGLTLTDGSNTGSLTVDANGINTDKSLDVNGSLKVGTDNQFVVDGSGNVSTNGTLSAGATTVTSLDAGSGLIKTTGTVSGGTVSATTALEVGTSGSMLKVNATDGTVIGGNATVNGTLTVGSANAITGTGTTLNINGNDLTNIKDLTTTGNATIGGTLNAGATTIAASGAGATTALNVTAADDSGSGSTTTFTVASDKATVGGDFKVTGDTNLSNTTVTGTLTISDGTSNATEVSAKSVTTKDYGGSTYSASNVLNIGNNTFVDGKLSSTNSLSVFKDSDGSGTKYDEVFTVDNTGSIKSDMLKTDNSVNTTTIGKNADTATNVLGKLSLNSTGATDPYVNAIDNGATAQTTGGANTMATVATVLKSAENGAYTGASDKNIAADSTIKTAIGALDTEIGADDDYVSTVNGVAGANSVKTNISNVNAALGNVSTVVVNGYAPEAPATKNLTDAVTKLNTNMNNVLGGVYKDDGTYDNAVLLNDTAPNGFETDATNLSDALKKYAENNQAATGVSYDADGSVATTYTKASAPKYDGLVAKSSLKSAIEQLDGNIGTVTNATHKNITASNTVNQNLDQIDAVLGDMYKLQADAKDTSSAMFERGNLTNGATAALTTDLTVADALSNIDQTLGKIHGLVANADDTTTTTGVAYYGNLAVGTTVEEHIEAVDAAIGDRRNLGSKNAAINDGTRTSVAAGIKAAGDAIGDMNFAQAHYVASENDLSGAVRSLDSNLYRVESDLHDLKRDFNRGMASMAAMSALVPNPRAHGNTSLAIGTGAYSGHTATAIGGFHYLTDNIMLNAGAAWGNSRDVSYRMGVTFSW